MMSLMYRLALVALLGAWQAFAQNGCMDPLDINYDPAATSDNGTACDKYCWEAAGLGAYLVTQFAPRWIAGEVDQTNLHLFIEASQKDPITWISLLSPMTTADENPVKRFEAEFIEHGRIGNTPGALWLPSYAFEQCWNAYEFTVDWFDAYLPDDLNQSSLIRHDMSGVTTFTGFIELRSFEDIQDIRDVNLTRWHTSIMKFDIVFYTTVCVMTGEVNVLDEYDVMFAIVEQATIILDPATDPPTVEAQIVLFTTVQWPFELANPHVSVADPDLGVTIIRLEDCEDPGFTQGAVAADNGVPACNTRFLIRADPEPGKCEFTGDYTATFDVVCAASIPAHDCPLRGGETVNVTFNLESENVCPTVIEEVHSMASATVYHTPRNGTEPRDEDDVSLAFLVMQRAHFEVQVAVIDLDDTIIEETIITEIKCCFDIDCQDQISLYLRGSDGMPATYFEPQVMMLINNYPASPTSPLPTTSDFSLLLHPSVFPVPEDSSLSFILKIVVDVTYAHTATMGVLDDGERKVGDKPSEKVQTVVRNIRFGGHELRHSVSLEEQAKDSTPRSVLTKSAFVLQDSSMEASVTTQIITPNRPDASTKDPAINADGELRSRPKDVYPSSDALRRAESLSTSSRIVLSLVLALFITALVVGL